MTPATASVGVWAGWAWPAEVRAFARERGAERHLDPLLEALARLFPTATQATAALDLDPELRDERHITFRVTVPSDDIPDYVQAHRAWAHELLRIVPAAQSCVFRAVFYPR